MQFIEYFIVALVLALALGYLVKTFWPKSQQTGCGCGNTNCKVPKPDLKKRPTHKAS
ncbi:FeoB-associated Cys-rich membrane protein [Coraliomargarita sinensis]|uniref:FeoB-associated Cys-rich membrane protein n=1 Tax=Coraliomargarita sinensis TaxID=2174842 RepID=UPI0013048993|nr:FeoB-associated Cys-rich membrane protein [Coraliomargarita sinensis]